MDDDVLLALDDLLAALEENESLVEAIRARAAVVTTERHAGQPYAALVMVEDRPLIVEMLRTMQDRLSRTGSRFRRAEARALRAEGLTYDQIAAVFGVTRQRVIALVADPPASSSQG